MPGVPKPATTRLNGDCAAGPPPGSGVDGEAASDALSRVRPPTGANLGSTFCELGKTRSSRPHRGHFAAKMRFAAWRPCRLWQSDGRARTSRQEGIAGRQSIPGCGVLGSAAHEESGGKGEGPRSAGSWDQGRGIASDQPETLASESNQLANGQTSTATSVVR